MKKVLYFSLFFSVVSLAGELADKQMEKFMEYAKKADYDSAASSIFEHVALLNEPAHRSSEITRYSRILNNIFSGHGKPLSYTKWRTRSLSTSMDETVYQINCEKSAWMFMLQEYDMPNGDKTFNEVRYTTEEDIFKVYAK